LNHPNIALIYGVEERAPVMELVEGQTPPNRCRSKPRSTSPNKSPRRWKPRTKKNITHRDMKPSSGYQKVSRIAT
jgi:serine/threonine-protein kinase